jgi:16S rRNA (guanine(527)-N(7))-methyltransferase RsmG
LPRAFQASHPVLWLYLRQVSENPPEKIAAALHERVRAVGAETWLTGAEESALKVFLEELSLWRGAIDLTGRLDPSALAAHAVESAFGARFLPPAGRTLDIGSGAGFPGIPLAILGHSITLLEPRQRRAVFLRHVLRRIPALKAEVVVGRVEKVPGQFAAATSRALGRFPERLATGGFLNDRGRLLIWTSDATSLAEGLAAAFELIEAAPIPGFARKAIAVFEKRSTGNRGGL